MNRGPIYLAGIERSGTSLMYALLATHPQIAMTRRTNLWTYFNNQYGNLNNPKNLERCLSIMSQYKRLRAIQIDTEMIRRDFYQGEKTYAQLFSIIEGHFAEKHGKPRWGDKSLNTERYMDDIFEVFPNAKVIHMLRDPRDRYASAKTRWTNMKGRVGAGTAMWLESVRLAKRGQKRYPGQYLVVRYEDLVAQPEEMLHKICEFLGEEYAPEMLTMMGAPSHRDKGSNSSYGKREVGTISTDSVARYRQVLSPQEIKYMQDFCKGGIEQFGYALDDIRFSFREWVRYIFADWIFNFARMSFWVVKETILGMKRRTLPARRLVTQKNVVEVS